MKVEYLVVDSGALIRNAPVHEIGKNIYTVEELVHEIKDKATKQRLQCLPYQFKFRKPSSDIIKLVTEFSKKTGDYPSLSATDIQLIALTFLLEKENVGVDHLNIKTPLKQTSIEPYSSDKNASLIGFYFPPNESSESNLNEDEKSNVETEPENRNLDNITNSEETENQEMKNEKEVDLSNSIDIEYNETNDSDDGDDEGWITPSNIEKVKKEMNCLSLDDSSITVACITTDFAMQNVLIQMGLKVVSVDGMQIRKVKTFILRCHACFKTTSDMNKIFCPNCGNRTLKRVSVTVNDDGTRLIHINFRKPINIRGTRYSLPMPKGGKHADNPLLFEDQPIPQNRPSHLARKKVDVFDPDYIANSSPFAINDVYSRAANLGIRNQKFNKRNSGRKK
ncbi:RNA-binding protein NOB1 [Centruroides vittatus]|uniref:RNA-binding protein NOB1 n=1 Tax=Centruroides vittatus TaxID=120091 RepID=UPI00350EF02C